MLDVNTIFENASFCLKLISSDYRNEVISKAKSTEMHFKLLCFPFLYTNIKLLLLQVKVMLKSLKIINIVGICNFWQEI